MAVEQTYRPHMTQEQSAMFDAQIEIVALKLEIADLKKDVSKYKPGNLRELKRVIETGQVEKLLIALLDDTTGNVRLRTRELLGLSN